MHSSRMLLRFMALVVLVLLVSIVSVEAEEKGDESLKWEMGEMPDMAMDGGFLQQNASQPQIASQEGILYEIRPVAGKGLGMVALKDIPRGTRLLIEEPLLMVPVPEMVAGQGFRINDMVPDLKRAFAALTAPQQEAYLALSDHRFPEEEEEEGREGYTPRLLSILRSNACNTGPSHIGLFPRVARINHSCRPNTGNWWSSAHGHRVIYATTAIRAGDELTFSYIPLLMSMPDRQARLAQYGFTCACPACSEPPSVEDDTSPPGTPADRRVYIADLLAYLEDEARTPKAAYSDDRLLAEATHLVDLLRAEAVRDYLPRAYHLVALFNHRLHRPKTARRWADRELEMLRFADGESAEVRAVLEFMEVL